jgi:tellurium resistance protein TerZ
MGINLSKGQKINLVKDSGEKLEQFCVEVSWGAIETIKKGFFGGTKKVIEDVDLDLSCIMLNAKGEVQDHLYSPEYNSFLQKNNFPLGKLKTKDGALLHSGDDLGKTRGADFKEVITVNLTKVDSNIEKIFFFLNIYLNQGQSFDFSHIPFVKIKMYEGTPANVDKEHMSFDVVTDSSFAGQQAIIMGKLYKRDSDWKFDAIGDASDDRIFLQTIDRIVKKYQ